MHIREHFAYCPKCGIEAESSENHRMFDCEHCGFTLYFNVGASVSGICLRENGDVLLLKRIHQPRKGSWTLPGGFTEPHESGLDALVREVYEETGLSVTQPIAHSAFPNTYVYKDVTYATFDMVYVCKVAGAPMLDGTEVDAHRWFSLTELLEAEISFPSLKNAIDLYVSHHGLKKTTG